MTETEWLTCDDPARLMGLISEVGSSDRKFRLFACACCRRLGALLSDADRAVLAALERCAEGELPPEKIVETAGVPRSPFGYTWGGPAQRAVAEAISAQPRLAAPRARAYAVDAARAAGGVDARAAEWRHQSTIARCVFGNPYRATVFRGEWLTDPVLALAREAYNTNDFSLVPILADALQEAGCDDPEVLNHCRTGNTHARGCWVLDRLLDKE